MSKQKTELKKVFEEEMQPLCHQLYQAAAKHGIGLVMAVQLENNDENRDNECEVAMTAHLDGGKHSDDLKFFTRYFTEPGYGPYVRAQLDFAESASNFIGWHLMKFAPQFSDELTNRLSKMAQKLANEPLPSKGS